MPRLFIAVVLIQISWPLFTGMLTATNSIAWGLEGIMYAPFGGYNEMSLSKILPMTAGGGELATIFGLGAGVTWLVLGPPGAIALAVAVLVAIFTAYFTLIIRQIVLIVLILTGPIALLAWILPNTEKLWKFWWSNFSKALLMYPLVLMLVAAGKIAAWSTAQNAGGKDFTATAMVLIFFFGPLFLLPKTFALAGGVIAGVSGAIAGKGAKISGMSNKWAMNRQGKKMSERAQKAKVGQLSRFKGINALTARATTKNFGIGRKGRKAYQQKMDLAAADYSQTANAKATQFEDNVLRAQTFESAHEAKQKLGEEFGLSSAEVDEAIAGAKAAGGFGKNVQLHAAQQLARTKTGYKDAAQAARVIDRVAGNNKGIKTSLRENIKFTSKQVGRNDLGALRDMNDEEIAMYESGNEAEAVQLWTDRMTVDGTETADSATLARNHKVSMDNIDGATRRLMGGSDPEYSDRAKAVASDLYQARSWATRGHAGTIEGLGGLETGHQQSDTVQFVSPNPEREGELIIRTERVPTNRPSTVASDAREQNVPLNNNDPNSPNQPRDED